MTDRSMQISSRNEKDRRKLMVHSISGNQIWTELMVKEKTTSKTIFLQGRLSKNDGPKHFWKSNLDRFNGQRKKNTSKTIISQILKPEMQIRKQKVTESKRIRPKRRADKKTTQIISGNLIWTEIINGERKKYRVRRAGRGHTGASGRRGRDVTS
jgi:hypothetical protein